MIPNYKEDKGFQITFNTTEDCNLRCKYCYEINKRNISLSFDYAKKFIDLICSDPNPAMLDMTNPRESFVYKDGLIADFIGGDALMNVDLVDKIMSYLIYKVYSTDNENCNAWKNHMRLSLSTNGTLFEQKKVRDFCLKWKEIISLGISIDGCPEIHDKNRIMLARGPNGEEIGSMQYILKWYDWYKTNFPNEARSTKATCSKDSIPYLYDSLVYMHDKLGIVYINQNFIMEDMGCTEEDYKELCKQLYKCVDYVLAHKDDLYWRIFDEETFAKHRRSEGDDWNRGQCGSGAMPALAIDGTIYPCFRWLPHTQRTEGCMAVGNIFEGFSHKENFLAVRNGSKRCNCTKESKCKTCEYESSCSYCIGGCYAEYGDFTRTTHICEITKIQCEFAKLYWNKYYGYEKYKVNYDIINR